MDTSPSPPCCPNCGQILQFTQPAFDLHSFRKQLDAECKDCGQPLVKPPRAA
jgi:hypothetical protein